MVSENENENRVRSLRDYIEFLDTLPNELGHYLLFRGQAHPWPLVPKLGRFQGNHNVLDAEERMLQDFLRELPSYLSLVPTSPWDILSVAQHHGLPTRLLDWTKNPLAALWFAIRGHSNEVVDPIIWIFAPPEEYVLRDLKEAPSPFEGERTLAFEPRHVTARIRAQDGVFTVHKYLTARSEGFVPLERNRAYLSYLRQVHVVPESVQAILIELRRCGIHGSSLFPDLDGLAKRIEDDQRAAFYLVGKRMAFAKAEKPAG